MSSRADEISKAGSTKLFFLADAHAFRPATGLRRVSCLWAACALALLISFVAWAESPDSAPSPASPWIALIIDDLGETRRGGDRVVALEGPVACAILPQTPYAIRIAERAHASNKEVMLHLPLQSVMQYVATSVGTIRIDTTRDEMSRILAIDLAAVPYAVGVNNHQGSLLTQHPGHMRWLMEELRGRGDLFFVDSFTSDSSVALRFAREQGVPSIRRDVFIDHEPTWEAIAVEFEKLKRMARSRGVAIGIAHPLDVTLSYLESAIPALQSEGIELVSVSDAIARGGRPMVQSARVEPQEGAPR